MTTPSDLPTLIQANVFATRESEYQHGFNIKLGEDGAILIYHIESGSEASKTDLCEGCEILSINDHRVASVQKAEEMLSHYMDKKGMVKIVASKGGRPRGTKYVLLKNTKDKAIFDGSDDVIDELVLEQRNGYVRVVEAPQSGFFAKVRLNKSDCIWSVDGQSVQDINKIREELKKASGKIVYLLIYNSFRKLKTTVMANMSRSMLGGDPWKIMMGAVGEDKATRLQDAYLVQEKVRL